MLMPPGATLLRNYGAGGSPGQAMLRGQQDATKRAAMPSSAPQQLGDMARSAVTAEATNEHAQRQRMFDMAAGVIQTKSATLPADEAHRAANRLLAETKLRNSLIPPNGRLAELAAMMKREA